MLPCAGKVFPWAILAAGAIFQCQWGLPLQEQHEKNHTDMNKMLHIRLIYCNLFDWFSLSFYLAYCIIPNSAIIEGWCHKSSRQLLVEGWGDTNVRVRTLEENKIVKNLKMVSSMKTREEQSEWAVGKPSLENWRVVLRQRNLGGIRMWGQDKNLALCRGSKEVFSPSLWSLIHKGWTVGKISIQLGANHMSN